MPQSRVLPDKTYRYLLRIPDELRQKLVESAASEGKSFNAEVRDRLIQSFEPRWAWRRRGQHNSVRGERMDFSTLRRRPRWVITTALLAALVVLGTGTALGMLGGDSATYRQGVDVKIRSEFGAAPLTEAGSSAELLKRNAYFMSRRTAGTYPLDAAEAGVARAAAA